MLNFIRKFFVFNHAANGGSRQAVYNTMLGNAYWASVRDRSTTDVDWRMDPPEFGKDHVHGSREFWDNVDNTFK